jgi:hypothetical protein
MMEQDSNDPTGVPGKTSGGSSGPGSAVPGNSVARARNRKANAAIQLALAGASWDDIALTLGYPTARTARVAVEKALEKQLASENDREKLRSLANARLNRLLRGVWSKAIDPDNPEHLLAATKARELIADHRKLYGLDAPTEVVVHNPTQNELEAWVAMVVNAGIPQVEQYSVIDGEVIDEEDDGDAVQAG